MFSKSGNSTILATGTSRIQIRDPASNDIADFRDVAGPDVSLAIKIDPNNANRWESASGDWRLLRPQD